MDEIQERQIDHGRKLSVLISVPNGDGWIHKCVAFALLKLLMDRRYRVRIIMPTWRPYENNLHHIVNEFMRGDAHFWLNIDADNPPMNNPLDLIWHDRDIIGLPTPVWHYQKGKGERPVYWNGYRRKGQEGYNEWLPREGLQEVDAVGTGCILFARRVFEHPNMRLAPFARTYHADGTVDRGNDIAFCERARENGFRIYCHYDYPCQHFGELELLEVVEAFRSMYEANN